MITQVKTTMSLTQENIDDAIKAFPVELKDNNSNDRMRTTLCIAAQAMQNIIPGCVTLCGFTQGGGGSAKYSISVAWPKKLTEMIRAFDRYEYDLLKPADFPVTITFVERY
jgi:hypothetical protein